MKKSYLPIGILALVFAAINACSGTEGAEIEDAGGANDTGSDTRPADSSTSTDGEDATTAKDAGKDTAVKDSAKDTSSEATVVNPTYAPEGSPCTMGSIENKACGLCGVSERACLPGDGGWVWGSWGFCQREASGPDVCDPSKVYPDGACGNCGTSKQICQNDCRFAKGLACSEPKDACKPGTSEFVVGLSCANPNEGRNRTCNATCKWDLAMTCTTPPANPNQIVISAVGSVKKTYQLDPAKMSKPPIVGACPASLDSVEIAASYVELKNTTALTATVSAWYEEDLTSTEFIFPYMAVYNGAYPPSSSDPVALGACVGRVVDECFANECSDFYAGLVLGDYGPITIAPGKSVTLYVGADVSSKQPYFLNVRTDSLK